MNARDYQNKLVTDFQHIFTDQPVEKEWDSVKYDPHFSNHKEVYAPRHDIAIGPFNDYSDLDCGIDNTKQMQTHPFIKNLINDRLQAGCQLKEVWNSFSRCFIALEIEFSGSLKHLLGSIINASANGSIGIVVGNRENIDKINRIYYYLSRLEYLERLKLNTLGNLFIFEEDQFLKLLSEFTPSIQIHNRGA
jgi:hypothetical protein